MPSLSRSPALPLSRYNAGMIIAIPDNCHDVVHKLDYK